jgi:hypothetical protein
MYGRIPGTTVAAGGATLAATGFPALLTGLLAISLLAVGLLLVRKAVVQRQN